MKYTKNGNKYNRYSLSDWIDDHPTIYGILTMGILLVGVIIAYCFF